MSEYAIYRMFDGCDAPYNVEFCGHLVGSRVWTGDDDPTALMEREHVRDGWHTEPPSDQGRMEVAQMAPTSDERREVAAWLRMQVGEEECIDYAVFRIINDVLGVNGAWGAKAAHILADLIDPTCHMTREFAETEFGRVFQGWLCDECMCTADVPDASEPPSYCPNCGARVVDDDN